jgi:hypothetical protein
LQIVSQQFAAPRFSYCLQTVEEFHRHISSLGHLVDGIAVQGLVDLSLFSVGYGDQDLGQVLGGAELQGVTPDQAISGLVAHDVIDDVSGA